MRAHQYIITPKMAIWPKIPDLQLWKRVATAKPRYAPQRKGALLQVRGKTPRGMGIRHLGV